MVSLGPVGSVGARQGPVWSHGSENQSYADTGQSSDPSGLVGFRRAKSVSDRFLPEPCFGMTGPDVARRIARLSHIGALLMNGRIQDPPQPWRSLTGPKPTNQL